MTGLEVTDPGRLAFVFQLDNRRAEPLTTGRGPVAGYAATVWTFEVDRWQGEISPDDPDKVVADARFVTLEEAIAHLEKLEWQAATVAYLRGELEPGSLVLRRWHADGRIEEAGSVQPAASGSRQRRPG